MKYYFVPKYDYTEVLFMENETVMSHEIEVDINRIHLMLDFDGKYLTMKYDFEDFINTRQFANDIMNYIYLSK